MALACVSGGRECGGCGRCFRDGPEYACPVCGEELYATVTSMKQYGIVLCAECQAKRKAGQQHE